MIRFLESAPGYLEQLVTICMVVFTLYFGLTGEYDNATFSFRNKRQLLLCNVLLIISFVLSTAGLVVGFTPLVTIIKMIIPLAALIYFFEYKENSEILFWLYGISRLLSGIINAIISSSLDLSYFLPIAISAICIVIQYRKVSPKLLSITKKLFVAYNVFELINLIVVAISGNWFGVLSLSSWFMLDIAIMLIVLNDEKKAFLSDKRRSMRVLSIISVLVVVAGLILAGIALFGNHGTEEHTYKQIYKDKFAEKVLHQTYYDSFDVTYTTNKIGETIIPGILFVIFGIIGFVFSKAMTDAKPKALDTTAIDNAEVLLEQNKKSKKTFIIATCAVAITICGIFSYAKIVSPIKNYNDGTKLFEEGMYKEAIEKFESLNGYKDSAEMITECKNGLSYDSAVAQMDAEKFEEAAEAFDKLGDFKDSKDRFAECKYQQAVVHLSKKEYSKAHDLLQTLSNYKDSNDKLTECKYQYAVELISKCEYSEAIAMLESIAGYKDSAKLLSESKSKLPNEELHRRCVNFSGDDKQYFTQHKAEYKKLTGSEIVELLSDRRWNQKLSGSNNASVYVFGSDGKVSKLYDSGESYPKGTWTIKNDSIVFDKPTQKEYDIYEIEDGYYCLYYSESEKIGAGNAYSIIWENN